MGITGNMDMGKTYEQPLEELNEEIDKIVRNIQCVWEFIGIRPCRTLFRQHHCDARFLKVPGSALNQTEDMMIGVPGVVFQECPALQKYVKDGILYIEDVDGCLTRVFLVSVHMRWVLRVNAAMCSLDSVRCSLKEFLLGCIKCGANPETCELFPIVLEMFYDTLRRRIGSSWKEFLDFVASFDSSPTKLRLNYSSFNMGRTIRSTQSFVWQLVDEIVVIYAMQQPLDEVPFLRFQGLFARFSMPPPEFNLDFRGLARWSDEYLQKLRLMKVAVRQAHNWVAAIECGKIAECEDTLHIASHVLSRPHEFPLGLRIRLLDSAKKQNWDQASQRKLHMWRSQNWSASTINPSDIVEFKGTRVY